MTWRKRSVFRKEYSTPTSVHKCFGVVSFFVTDQPGERIMDTTSLQTTFGDTFLEKRIIVNYLMQVNLFSCTSSRGIIIFFPF